MNLKDELKKINEHFDNIDPDSLYKNLIDCGLGIISDPAEHGVLAYHDDLSNYAESSIENNTVE